MKAAVKIVEYCVRGGGVRTKEITRARGVDRLALESNFLNADVGFRCARRALHTYCPGKGRSV